MTLISNHLIYIKTDVSKSCNFKIQPNFIEFAKISILYSENHVQLWKNEICKIQSNLHVDVTLIYHYKHKKTMNIRKHTSNSSSSKMYVSTQFSKAQVNSGCHKCVQHISLGYAPKEFYSSLYKVVQIWPGLIVYSLHTKSPGHIWTTLY